MRSTAPRVVETWLVFLIAAHSGAVAVFLVLYPEWSAEFGGWGDVSAAFFARQAGVFHFVVALGYLYEYLRYRGVALLLMAKSAAVLFLTASWLLSDDAAWAVPFSALADGLMALVVLVVHRWARDRRN